MLKPDWTGTKSSTFKTLGASNHADHARQEHDYYATEPRAMHDLLEDEVLNKDVWEPACGGGHLSRVLEKWAYTVRKSDIIDRGVGAEVLDFLTCTTPWHGDIVTNPPYRYAQEFVEHALSLVSEGSKVCMFLKLTFLEGQARYPMFQSNPPARVRVFSSRRKCAINGDFASTGSSAACYAWFIWEKGFKGSTTLEWIQ